MKMKPSANHKYDVDLQTYLDRNDIDAVRWPNRHIYLSSVFFLLNFIPSSGAWARDTDQGGSFTLAQTRAVSPPVAFDAPMTPRVIHLLHQMTIDEKIAMVHLAPDPEPGKVGSVGYFPGVPRLGIPERRDADALGIQVIKPSTALPSRIGWAASFDRAAVYAAGQLVGSEGRALGVQVVYAPQSDLARLPNWGRNNATFGEDPFLAGQLAIQEVDGIQSQGLMAQIKHYAFYDGQPGTEYFTPQLPVLPTIVDEQTAHELYLKPFEYAVTEAHPSSVMLSYQGVKIIPTQATAQWMTENSDLIHDTLRGLWGFEGFTESDYDAVHDVRALLSGTDVDTTVLNPTGTSVAKKNYYSSDLKSLVDPSSSHFDRRYANALDRATVNILYEYERFGLLPPDNESPSNVTSRPDMASLKQSHIRVVERLAEESAILLKNQSQALPLRPADLESLAVIGPGASQLMVDGNQWERSRGFPDRDAISPLQMLRAFAPTADIRYELGLDLVGNTIPTASFSDLSRKDDNEKAAHAVPLIDYGDASTRNDLKPGRSYTWEGTLNVPADDTYLVSIQRSWLDGLFVHRRSTTLSIDGVNQNLTSPGVPVATYAPGIVPRNGTNEGVTLKLTAGHHRIVVRADIPDMGYYPIDAFAPIPVGVPIIFRLSWSRLRDTVASAVLLAKSTKTVVLFVDDSGLAEEEMGIQSHNIVERLPERDEVLINAVAHANPRTIVVMSTGNPVIMPWLGKVKAVIENWYPGQEGATAIAKLLLGLANPSGKSPITWPATRSQTPFSGHAERFSGDGKAVYYTEGLLMGYRWYDAKQVTPLFPFGYGLSYTQFRYSNLTVVPDPCGLLVSFTITNIGSATGTEIPQIYVGSPPAIAGVQDVPRKLVGFDRVDLDPGEEKKQTICVSKRELSYWSTVAHDWILPNDKRAIYVGASSRDIRLVHFSKVK